MTQYIDKSALVTWLKERIREYWSDSENTMGIFPYALEEVIKYVDTLEVKEVDLEKTKWSPSKKQMESLKDMLKYNIGVFNYQKFMEVNSLYEDLTNSKLFDETDRQK